MDDVGKDTKKRKREHGEGSTTTTEDTASAYSPTKEVWQKDHLNNDVLPPPSEAPLKDTCWAQACVMAVEANFRLMYAVHYKEFPRLSIIDCIDSLRTLEKPIPSLDEVYTWLEEVGVATHEDYQSIGKEAKPRYKIAGITKAFRGQEIFYYLKFGVLVGGFHPDDTKFEADRFCPKESNSSKRAKAGTTKRRIGHVVVLIGWEKVDERKLLIFYTGYGTVEKIELECMEFARLLCVPDKPPNDS